MPLPKRREGESSVIDLTDASDMNDSNYAGNATATSNTSATSNGNSSTTSNVNNKSNSTTPIQIDMSKLQGHQQEQELFLQAFEKPTQIYRYLRNRHATSPIFLNRTLSYMKDRMSRSHAGRATCKINNILDTVTKKLNTDANNFLNIILIEFFDNSGVSDVFWKANEEVNINVTLNKITKNKRKDSTADFQEVFAIDSPVIYKPDENQNINLYAFSIPVQSLRPIYDQHTIYKLIFTVKVAQKEEDKNTTVNNNEAINFGCELMIVEKNVGIIPAGEYEIALQRLNSKSSVKSFSPKKRTWETLPVNYVPLTNKFDVFNTQPVIKLRLTWTSQKIPRTIPCTDITKYGNFIAKPSPEESALVSNTVLDSKKALTVLNTNANENNNNNNKRQQNKIKINKQQHINDNNNNNNEKDLTKTTTNKTCASNNEQQQNKEKIQIVYNFLYSNNTHQQTEYTQDLLCPWCHLDCLRLYALLKHLKLCHSRFNFTYQPTTTGAGARIDVTINDAFDGSYAGSPYDLVGPSGSSFPRTGGAVRRTSVTNLLVCRPRRQKTCLEEFLVLDEDDLTNQRPYITGHNRLYHHTETCLPVQPKELDIDSEGENDPLWLRQKTIQMIDEFSDVNEGEKELMKMWNLHIMKYGYVGDCQLPLACEMFVEDNGNEIIHKNLYRNFILHLSSLFDYGLLSPENVHKTVQKLQSMLSKDHEGQEVMSRQREVQLRYWLEVGIHKQDEQKLKPIIKPEPKPEEEANNENSDNDNKSKEETSLRNSIALLMTPPMKRVVPAVKRASILPRNIMSNEANKFAAKKSTGKMDDEQHNSNGDERILSNLKRRESSNSSSMHNLTTRRSVADKESSLESTAVKRRLLARGTSPAAKFAKNTKTQTAPKTNNNNVRPTKERRSSLHYSPSNSSYNIHHRRSSLSSRRKLLSRTEDKSPRALNLRRNLSLPVTTKRRK